MRRVKPFKVCDLAISSRHPGDLAAVQPDGHATQGSVCGFVLKHPEPPEGSPDELAAELLRNLPPQRLLIRLALLEFAPWQDEMLAIELTDGQQTAVPHYGQTDFEDVLAWMALNRFVLHRHLFFAQTSGCRVERGPQREGTIPGVFLTILGRPGAGKTTLGNRLQVALGVPYIGGGQLLREYVKSRRPNWEAVKRSLELREDSPADLQFRVLAERLEETHASGAILDGFPKTKELAEMLDRELPSPVAAAIYLDTPVEVAEYRVSQRRICDVCYMPASSSR